jgi:thioesterase domain-containing protein/acyl carrier protein
VQWLVLDDQDQLRPFGIPGHLAFQREGAVHRTGIRARIHHDGTLTEVVAKSAQPSKKVPTRPSKNTSDLEQRLELRLCFLLQKMLGLRSVTPEQDFFDLGGNSLIAVRLFGSIQEEFGVAMSIGVLFDHPTVEGLANHLGSRMGGAPDQVGASAWSTIVRIQPAGSRLPLFCVAGVGGNPMNMRHLARALGPEQPFYGLQHRGVDGTLRPHKRVEDMAAEFLIDIKRVQPHGPYLLSGFSGGGLAAFEAARQLTAAGDKVALVVLFDTYYPQLTKRGLRDRVVAHWVQVMTTGPQYFTERLVERVRGTITRATGTLKAYLATANPYKFRHEAVEAAWRSAERHYQPGSYSGPILLIRAALPPDGVSGYQVDENHGWRQSALGPIYAVDVPGDHTGIVKETNAVATAKAMQPYLDRAAKGLSPPSPARMGQLPNAKPAPE